LKSGICIVATTIWPLFATSRGYRRKVNQFVCWAAKWIMDGRENEPPDDAVGILNNVQGWGDGERGRTGKNMSCL